MTQHGDEPMTQPPMIATTINGRWELLLPEHRAARPQWVAWEVERLASMHRNIRPGDLVFDVGTEEGDLSALFADWGADIVMFEPNPLVWPNIRVIFEGNELTHRVRGTYAGFADDKTYEANRLVKQRDGWPETAYGPVIGDHGFCRPEERPDLPRVTLSDYARRHGLAPTILTLDVEGSELRVMHGASSILHRFQPLVYISVHPDFMHKHYDQDPQQLFDYMESFGYRHLLLETDHEQHWVFYHPDGRGFIA